MNPRVLHVGPLPPPLGGIGVMMQSLMQSEPLRTFENSVFSTSWGTSWELVGHKRLEPKRVLRRVKFAVNLALLTRRIQPEIIHFQCGSGGPWDFPGDSLMFLGSRSSKAKTIFHWHRNPSVSVFPGKFWVTKALFSKTAGKADALVVLSDRYRQIIPASIRDKTFVIPNTYDPRLLSLNSSRLDNDSVRIIFIGRLTREKGILDLLRVASRVAEEMSAIKFVLAGAPSPVEGGSTFLRKIVEDLGIQNNVEFIGPVIDEAKLQLFRQGDILLFPSYRESFGIAVLEGMASAIPVVAYSIDLIPDLVANGRTGYLVSPGDIQSLADRIFMLASDPKLRVRMGQCGRELVQEKYSLDVVASNVKNLYLRLLENL